MESWKEVWRKGFAPNISIKAMKVLEKALVDDDPRLLQGATTSPPPLMCVQDWPVEAACLVGYCGWQGEGLRTVEEVENYFARSCFDADSVLGEPALCRWFLNWFDETPREEMRQLLLPEIRLSIQKKEHDEKCFSGNKSVESQSSLSETAAF